MTSIRMTSLKSGEQHTKYCFLPTFQVPNSFFKGKCTYIPTEPSYACFHIAHSLAHSLTHPRSFAKPPHQVQTVCECVVIMRGYKEVSWKTAKGMMSDTNFLNSLKNMDVDGITVSQVLYPIHHVAISNVLHMVSTV